MNKSILILDDDGYNEFVLVNKEDLQKAINLAKILAKQWIEEELYNNEEYENEFKYIIDALKDNFNIEVVTNDCTRLFI